MLHDLRAFDSFLGGHCDWTRLAPNLRPRSWSSIRNLLPVVFEMSFWQNDLELLGQWLLSGAVPNISNCSCPWLLGQTRPRLGETACFALFCFVPILKVILRDTDAGVRETETARQARPGLRRQLWAGRQSRQNRAASVRGTTRHALRKIYFSDSPSQLPIFRDSDYALGTGARQCARERVSQAESHGPVFRPSCDPTRAQLRAGAGLARQKKPRRAHANVLADSR